MIKSMKKKWVAALRSGKFKQTTGVLCQVDNRGRAKGHCCLGVLCQVAKTEGFKIKIERDKFSDVRNYSYDGEVSQSELPAELARELKLRPASLKKLMTMNDNDGKDFNQIADHIEKKL